MKKTKNPFRAQVKPLRRKSADESVRNTLRELKAELTIAKDSLALQSQLLLKANTEMERFAHVLSHDLQEPLRTLAGYAKLFAHRYLGKMDADADTFITHMTDAATRMGAVIADLQRYARSGLREKTVELVDCEKVFADSIVDLNAAIATTNAVITHDPLPSVRGDRGHLEQVFCNLLDNALKFRGGQPPRIHVSAQNYGRYWLFAVRDHGMGLDLQYAERIFHIFQRLHAREDYPGTGVGLALCRRIVEAHEGRIWVDSHPDAGAIFYFTILAQD